MGRLLGMLKKIVLGIVIFFAALIGLAVLSSKGRKPEAPTPMAPASSATVATPAAPNPLAAPPEAVSAPSPPSSIAIDPRGPEPGPVATPDALAPGTIVEVVGKLIASDRAVYDGLFAPGADTSRFRSGKEKFGVSPSTTARVIEQQGQAVHLAIVGGNWKGREGWIPRDGVRPTPTPQESEGDVRFGLPMAKRREVYGELYRAGMLATFEADRRVPTATKVGDADEFVAAQREHVAVYEAAKRENRRKVLAKYRLSGEQAEAIDAEGVERHWPLPEVARSELASAKSKPKTFDASRSAQIASNQFRAAKKLDNDGKLADAVVAYRKVIEDFPDSPEARMATARVKALTGQ